MSTELVIRIWTGDASGDTGQRLMQLVELVEDWKNTDEQWQKLCIHEDSLSNEVLNLSGPLTREELGAALEKHQGGGMLRISTRTALSCWRFHGMEANEGFLPIWVESWGREFAASGGRDYDVEGDAALALSSVGPYCALRSSTSDPSVNRINEHVEENLEKLLELLLAIADTLRPAAMKVFTDRGMYQPLNAHAVFFRDAEALLDDFRFLRRLWNEGLPGYQTAPLRNSLDQPDRDMLHGWRDEAAQRTLITRLNRVIHLAEHIGVDDLERIDWERFDSYEGTAGRMVLEYPHFINAFVDRFYLELLEAKQARARG